MAMGILRKRQFAREMPDPAGSRSKIVLLTPEGGKARGHDRQRLAETEKNFAARFGRRVIARLRQSLQRLPEALLFQGMTPYPGGWRASTPKPRTLPHYPMVLHRGGYPDGS